MEKFDPVSFFNSFPLFGSEDGFKPGLGRVKFLLEELNYSENNLNFIHVAGSNGKGSTIAMLESIYMKAGFSVGRYISPHLEEFEERITLNGRNISRKELKELALKIRGILADGNNAQKKIEPTFFEVVTAAALFYFSKKEPDIVLLETGLGGRYDATNVIKHPRACVITSIDLEHTDYLGDTLAEIAAEKAGIIKPGSTAICGEKKKEPCEKIAEISSEAGVPLFFSGEYFEVKDWEEKKSGQIFTLQRRENKYKIKLNLLGEHQLKNAATACTTVDVLDNSFSVSPRDIREGLAEVVWPGRLEIVREKPPFLVDGSHTPAGMKYLREYLNREFRDIEVFYIVLAVLQGKKLKEMLDELENIHGEVKIIFSHNSSPRALIPSQVDKDIKSEVDEFSRDNLKRTVDRLVKSQRDRELICITGSLYSVIDIKKALKNNDLSV